MKIPDLPEFRALCRGNKFLLKAFVAAHYERMKFEIIFNILPYSAFLFYSFHFFF